MNEIYTYPEMNGIIKDLLRRSEEPMNRYILARIEELERENDIMKKAVRELLGTEVEEGGKAGESHCRNSG